MLRTVSLLRLVGKSHVTQVAIPESEGRGFFYAWKKEMNSERRGSTASNGGTKRRGSVIVTLPGGRVHRIMPMPPSDCMVPTRF